MNGINLSIIAANVNSPEWGELLVQSIRKFTNSEYEIIIVDNGSNSKNIAWFRQQKDIQLIEMGGNTGHGAALDTGTRAAQGKWGCGIDIDAHFQRSGWDTDLMELYHSNPAIRLIGCKGPEIKPLHPPLFFFEREFFLEHGILFKYQPGVKGSTDSTQKAYWDILELGYEVFRFETGTKIYDAIGDEFWISGKPTIYHQYYGSRFQENDPTRTAQSLDGISLETHLKNKAKLFEQPFVKEILGFIN
jgi:glycosyltransferase involved in cell wall biosynthesis